MGRIDKYFGNNDSTKKVTMYHVIHGYFFCLALDFSETFIAALVS